MPGSNAIPVTTKAPRPSFPGLDSLRALAAAGVVATHVAFYAGAYDDGFWGTVLARLDVGVAVFFVLSGFLLGRPYIASMRTGRRHDSVGRYFWKRALRILPVVWVTLIAAYVVLPTNRDLPLWRWVSGATLTDPWLAEPAPEGLSQLWSLTIEASFYLVLPLLMWSAARLVHRAWSTGRLYWSIGALVIVNIVWAALATTALQPLMEVTVWWLPMYIAWFALGLAFAIASVDDEATSPLTRLFRALAASPSTCWVCAGALFLIACTPIAGPTLLGASPTPSVVKPLLYASIAGFVILPSVLGDPATTYARVLKHPILRHLGHISFAVFCCHQLVLFTIADQLGWEPFLGHGPQLAAATFAVSVVAAELLHWGVERPAQRWRDVRRTPATRTPIDTATSS